jgi:hypothetical protein
MPRQQTNPKNPDWKYGHAVATHSLHTLHVYTWTCPDCKTVNLTKVDLKDGKMQWREYYGIEARCGHCHGTKRKLTNKSGLSFNGTET